MPRVLNKTLYVETPGLNVELDQGALHVKGEDPLVSCRIPIHELAGIVVFGGVTVTQPLALHLADQGLAVTYLTQNGDFRARLAGPLGGSPDARMHQYEVARQPQDAVRIAAQFVRAKVHNSHQLLTSRGTTTDAHQGLQSAHRALQDLSLSREPVTGTAQVIAIEAKAAQIYFEAFGALISPNTGFSFTGRNRRPPRDPVNAMLSFGYTLLANECEGALHAAGLDPAVGFLHQPRPGRASLALDLMEEFRPLLIDALVLKVVNHRMVSPAEFEATTDGGVRMAASARKTFLGAYESRKQRLVTHPRGIGTAPLGLLPLVQARHLADVLRNGTTTYEGYRA